jgi:hypothetical protein
MSVDAPTREGSTASEPRRLVYHKEELVSARPDPMTTVSAASGASAMITHIAA